MKKHSIPRQYTIPPGIVALAAAIASCPTIALAEEEGRSGIALLIPTPAELIPAIIAFIIIFIMLSKLVWPTVMQMMSDREAKLNEQVEAADEAIRKSQEAEREAEEIVADAHRKGADIVAEAKQEAEQERTRILYEAQKQSLEIIEKGHKAVDSERQRAMADLSRSVADLSVDIAGKIIGESLDDKAHRKLALRYLDEMENGNA